MRMSDDDEVLLRACLVPLVLMLAGIACLAGLLFLAWHAWQDWREFKRTHTVPPEITPTDDSPAATESPHVHA